MSRVPGSIRSDWDDEAGTSFEMLSKLHYSRASSPEDDDEHHDENRPKSRNNIKKTREWMKVDDNGEVKAFNPPMTVRDSFSRACMYPRMYQTAKNSEIQEEKKETPTNIANKLTTLITKDNCYLCKVNTSLHNKHYDNPGHYKKVAEWIEQELGEVKKPVDQNLIFCPVCNVPLSGNVNALSHYSGQKHKKKEKTFCTLCLRGIDAADMEGHLQSKQHMKKSVIEFESKLRNSATRLTNTGSLRVTVSKSNRVPTKEALEHTRINESSFYPFPNKMPAENGKIPKEQSGPSFGKKDETSSTNKLNGLQSTKSEETTRFEGNPRIVKSLENNDKITDTKSGEILNLSEIIDEVTLGLQTYFQEQLGMIKNNPNVVSNVTTTDQTPNNEPNNIQFATKNGIENNKNVTTTDQTPKDIQFGTKNAKEVPIPLQKRDILDLSKIDDKSLNAANHENNSNDQILIGQKLIDTPLQTKNTSSLRPSSNNFVYSEHILKNIIETDNIKFSAEILKFKSITSKSLNTKANTDFSVIQMRIFAILIRNFSSFLTNYLRENLNDLFFEDIFSLSENDSFTSNLFSYSLIFDVYDVAKITLRDECKNLETFARNYQGTIKQSKIVLIFLYEFNKKLLIIFDECFLINDAYRLNDSNTADLEGIINQYFAINQIHCLWNYIKKFKIFVGAKTLKNFEGIFECNIEFLENIDYKKNIQEELKTIWKFRILDDFFNHFAIFKWKLLVILKGHLWNMNRIHDNEELVILRNILNKVLRKPNKLGQVITKYLKNLKLAILNRYQVCGGFDQHNIFLVESSLEKPLILNLFRVANEWDINQLNVYKEFDDLCCILSAENDNFAMNFLFKFNEKLQEIVNTLDNADFVSAMECSCAGKYCIKF